MFKSLGRLLKDTFSQWQEDRGQQIGAALAFYSIFSLPPVLLIAVTISGAVLGPKADEEQTRQLEDFFGRDQAKVLAELTKKAHRSPAGPWATAGSVIVLFISATGAALALKEALDTVWGVAENPDRGWWSLIGDRLLALLLVFAFGGLSLASMTLTTLFVNMGDYLMERLGFSLPVAQVVNIAVSAVVVTLLLAITFKLLPDVRVRWREVIIGAIVTAALFMIGKELIGVYLGRVAVGSTYGAAGSLVLVMLWIYYSVQILLLGAEFTQALAARSGAPIEPIHGAVRIANRRERDEQRRKSRAARAAHPSRGVGWTGLIWALGGLALGWLIGIWNR
jgi:membrane protein